MMSVLVAAVVYTILFGLVKLARKLNSPSQPTDEVAYYYGQDEQGQAFLREQYLTGQRSH
jgi:hypothetical protein